MSAPDAVMHGITNPSDAARQAAVEAAAHDAPCAALFGGWPGDGSLPIAYFASFQCPYCRVLEPELDALVERESRGVRLIHHELPIFGPASELAARASLAAAAQGRQLAMSARLRRLGLVPEEGYIRAVAEPLGLDWGRLRRDMRSEAVTRRIEASCALARLLSFVGTPALVVGRTAVEGRVPRPHLKRLVEAERDLPPPCAGERA